MCLDFNKVVRLRYKETGEVDVPDVFAAVKAGTAKGQDLLDEDAFRNLSYLQDIELTQTIWRPRVRLCQDLGRVLNREAEAIKTLFREHNATFWHSFGERTKGDGSSADDQLASGFVAYNAKSREVLVVVQGSYVASSDSVVNADAWGIKFGDVVDAYYATEPREAAPADGSRTPEQESLRDLVVHSGYAWLALHIYTQIIKIVKTQLVDQKNPVDEIVITGHSLGSAVAAQVFLLHQYFEATDFPSTRFSALLFAQPRSVVHRNISDELAPLFEKAVLDIRNISDPVVNLSVVMYEPLGSSVEFERKDPGCLVEEIAHGHDQDVYKGFVVDIFEKFRAAPVGAPHVFAISTDRESRALQTQTTSWKEFAGRESGGESYHIGDITRGLSRKVCGRSGDEAARRLR